MSGRAAVLLLASAMGGVPTVVSAETCASLAPLERKRPVYPRLALRNGQEGFVDLLLEIGTDGRVAAAKVQRAEPEGVFVEAAETAVRDWRFSQPAAPCTGIQRVEFRLGDLAPDDAMKLPPEASQQLIIKQTPEGVSLVPPRAEPAGAKK